MDRRKFLSVFCAGTVALVGGRVVQRSAPVASTPAVEASPVMVPTPPSELVLNQDLDVAISNGAMVEAPRPGGLSGDAVTRYLEKIKNFESAHIDDIYVTAEQEILLKSTVARLGRVQNYVGYGHFNLLSLDDMLFYARNYSAIGKFTKAELDFIEHVYFINAEEYGFYGDKVITKMTQKYSKADTYKVPGSGHYVFRGDALAKYKRVRSDVGGDLVLTSGIRSVVKQMHLFLNKTVEADGNFSRASRSLAPPGHSYHGIGDFDVGCQGFGAKNFTSAFAKTDEYKRLTELGYIDIRYTRTNLEGVRFEPWHVKVV